MKLNTERLLNLCSISALAATLIGFASTLSATELRPEGTLDRQLAESIGISIGEWETVGTAFFSQMDPDESRFEHSSEAAPQDALQ